MLSVQPILHKGLGVPPRRLSQDFDANKQAMSLHPPPGVAPLAVPRHGHGHNLCNHAVSRASPFREDYYQALERRALSSFDTDILRHCCLERKRTVDMRSFIYVPGGFGEGHELN